ncbi:MAG TPA: hypothetical protein VFS56_12170 [Gemmatimonadaceae bacterium]|nr:hypothetical protein [Gemmatimonadaceae bacterium]
MIEHDFPEDFTPIAAELQRLPYLSPSRGFADRVISRIDRLNPVVAVAPVARRSHLELQRGGQLPVRRRSADLVRGAAKGVAAVAIVSVAAFMFVAIDILTAILAAGASQYALVIAAVSAEAGAMVLGAETLVYLQAGAVEALLIYLTLAVGLLGGYAGIRTAASIAKRKAA